VSGSLAVDTNAVIAYRQGVPEVCGAGEARLGACVRRRDLGVQSGKTPAVLSEPQYMKPCCPPLTDRLFAWRMDG